MLEYYFGGWSMIWLNIVKYELLAYCHLLLLNIIILIIIESFSISELRIIISWVPH